MVRTGYILTGQVQGSDEDIRLIRYSIPPLGMPQKVARPLRPNPPPELSDHFFSEFFF